MLCSCRSCTASISQLYSTASTFFPRQTLFLMTPKRCGSLQQLEWLDRARLTQCRSHIRVNKIDRLLISTRNSLFSGSPSAKNLKVKRAWLGLIWGWVTDWEVDPGCAQVRTKYAGKTIVTWFAIRPVRNLNLWFGVSYIYRVGFDGGYTSPIRES